jgi:hypothetical protein
MKGLSFDLLLFKASSFDIDESTSSMQTDLECSFYSEESLKGLIYFYINDMFLG